MSVIWKNCDHRCCWHRPTRGEADTWGIGLPYSYRLASLPSLVGLYDNLMPELTFSPPVRNYEFGNWSKKYCDRRGIILSGVFQNIDPPPPHRPASVSPPPLMRGEDTLAGWRGGGVSIFWKMPDTALSVLYIRKYFVIVMLSLLSTKNPSRWIAPLILQSHP